MDGNGKGIGIGDVAGQEQRAEFSGQRLARRVLNIDKADLAPIGGKGADDGSTDTAGTAGDKDGAAPQAGVCGIVGNFAASDQLFAGGIEQAGAGHVNRQFHHFALFRAVVRIEPAHHFLAADPQHRHGFCPGRFHHFNRS